MKRYGLFIVMVLVLNVAYAQRGSFSQFAFTLGYANVNATRLNDFLPLAGANNFTNDNFAFGFLFSDTYGRGIVEFDFGGAFNNQNGSLFRTQATYSHILLKGGYTILNGDRFRLYPLFGLGIGGTNIEISNNNNIQFNSLGTAPFQEINLTLPNLLLDLSFGGDFKVSTREGSECKGNRHFVLGFRAGYFYNVPNNNWRYTGGSVNGAPSFGAQGAYVRATIGFGRSK